MCRSIWVLLLTLFSCTSTSGELPVLSYTIDDSGKKIYYSIVYEAGHFTDQSGNEFANREIQNKVYLANFFFTRCPSICPPMRSALIDISESLSEESNFMIVSHTIDPNHDTSEILNTYSEATGIAYERWKFIRGEESYTKMMARQYMTNFKPNETGTDFYHSSYAALVDRSQNIRGFYNLLVQEDVDRLKRDITQLID